MVVAGDFTQGHPGLLTVLDTDTLEVHQNAAPAMAIGSDPILRHIGSHREWTKRYGVIANLVRNPKTPIGLTLNMVARLNPRDIKNLTVDRNVPEVVRKYAMKFVKTPDAKR